MVYDLLDAKRQWRTYLDNLKLIHVPNQADLAAAALAAQGKLCLVDNIIPITVYLFALFGPLVY